MILSAVTQQAGYPFRTPGNSPRPAASDDCRAKKARHLVNYGMASRMDKVPTRFPTAANTLVSFETVS